MGVGATHCDIAPLRAQLEHINMSKLLGLDPQAYEKFSFADCEGLQMVLDKTGAGYLHSAKREQSCTISPFEPNASYDGALIVELLSRANVGALLFRDGCSVQVYSGGRLVGWIEEGVKFIASQSAVVEFHKTHEGVQVLPEHIDAVVSVYTKAAYGTYTKVLLGNSGALFYTTDAAYFNTLTDDSLIKVCRFGEVNARIEQLPQSLRNALGLEVFGGVQEMHEALLTSDRRFSNYNMKFGCADMDIANG